MNKLEKTKELIIKLADIYLDGIKAKPTKYKIMKILFEEGGLTISQLTKGMKSKYQRYTYRTIWQHVQELERDGCINFLKMENYPGQPVFLSLSQTYMEVYSFLDSRGDFK